MTTSIVSVDSTTSKLQVGGVDAATFTSALLTTPVLAVVGVNSAGATGSNNASARIGSTLATGGSEFRFFTDTTNGRATMSAYLTGTGIQTLSFNNQAMDINNAGNVGVGLSSGTAGITARMHIKGGQVTDTAPLGLLRLQNLYTGTGTVNKRNSVGIEFASGDTGAANSTVAGIYSDTTSPNILLNVNGTNVSTFTSSGLAITGTLSTTGQVSTTATLVGELKNEVSNGSPSGYSSFSFVNTGGTAQQYTLTLAGSATVTPGQLYIYDTTAAAIRLTLDKSGNLFLGTSAATYSRKALVIDTGGAAGYITGNSNNGVMVYANNLRYNAGDNFGANGWAHYYAQNASTGTHAWFTSTVSGTAPAGITFTQAMTLDSSGTLQVGTTTPIRGASLTVKATSNAVDIASGTTAITITATPTTLIPQDGCFLFIARDNTSGGMSIGTYDNSSGVTMISSGIASVTFSRTAGVGLKANTTGGAASRIITMFVIAVNA